MFKHVWMEGFAGDDFYIAIGVVVLPEHRFKELLLFGFRSLFAEIIGMPADKVKLKRMEISEVRDYLFLMDMDTNVLIYMADIEESLIEGSEDREEGNEDDESAV